MRKIGVRSEYLILLQMQNMMSVDPRTILADEIELNKTFMKIFQLHKILFTRTILFAGLHNS